jgi:hypothetical protein
MKGSWSLQLELLGFGVYQQGPDRPGVGWSYSVFAVPYWFICLLLTVPVIRWVMRYRGEWTREWRRSQSLCASCGYDVRVGGVRCPECGTPVSAALEEPDRAGDLQALSKKLKQTKTFLGSREDIPE